MQKPSVKILSRIGHHRNLGFLHGQKIYNSMSVLAEGVRNQSIVVIELFDFIESVLNFSDAVSEIENARKESVTNRDDNCS
ncbi:MAG: hypothetical protein ACI89Z_000865 [Porticoccus sp.]|jgi:hypothetical protein